MIKLLFELIREVMTVKSVLWPALSCCRLSDTEQIGAALRDRFAAAILVACSVEGADA
jgi:hypothetical protein